MTEQKQNEGLFRKSFRLAKNECCNYSEVGPRKWRHYCWMEPKASNYLCLVLNGMQCQWFEERVLPLNADLMRQWHRIFGAKESIIHSAAWTKSARCECGKLFRSQSNRQTRCEECSVKHRRKMKREYRNLNREQNGRSGTVRA